MFPSSLLSIPNPHSPGQKESFKPHGQPATPPRQAKTARIHHQFKITTPLPKQQTHDSAKKKLKLSPPPSSNETHAQLSRRNPEKMPRDSDDADAAPVESCDAAPYSSARAQTAKGL